MALRPLVEKCDGASWPPVVGLHMHDRPVMLNVVRSMLHYRDISS